MAQFPPSILEEYAAKHTSSRQSSVHLSGKPSWDRLIPPPSIRKGLQPNLETCGIVFRPSEDESFMSSQKDSDNTWDGPADTEHLSVKSSGRFVQENSFPDTIRPTSEDYEASSASDAGSSDIHALADLGLSFGSPDNASPPKQIRFPLEEPNPVNNRLNHEEIDAERPFNRWMKHLQKKNKDNQRRMTINGPLNGLENGSSSSPTRLARFRHQKSSSESSSGFVTAIKSASISLASLSIAPPSKRTGVSSHHNRTEISSRTSQIGRRSEDNSFIARSAVVDQGVTARLLQRRHVLEELITTEENYVADVKFLQHAYVNLMGSIPSLTPNLRASINLNLSEIIEMHEGLLRDLHKIIPCSDYMNVNCIEENKPTPPTHGHNRWRSLDAVPEHTSNGAWLQKVPGMSIEPQTAAEVARAFGQRLSRFFVYEEYGAKYEIMLKDVTATYRTMPQWLAFEKGLEALATALASLNTKTNIAKKALTTGDLLVKPLQRVCKYPLLFGELLKQTPVCDCPDSHLAIENVLIRLREATAEINRATDDPHMKIAIEKSWILQDRLLLHAQSETRSKVSVRNLGHINLCGVLYVSWQTKDGVEGQYLICLLYRDYLLLASAARPEQVYTIQAWIGRSDMRVEELDNGRGLQCHTALFSWKLVFEIDHQLLELTMSACSPKEETEWRERLAAQPCNSCVDAREETSMSFLTLDVKSLGTIFGKPGTIARRMSIHRATTIGQMTGLCHVIIKNTTAFKDIGISAASTSINRSQSLLSTKRIPVLAPLRGERIRLEALLADVWSRELLPFPGMVGRARGDVRTSASSIMRKLSVASIASNFTKRSSSMASIHKPTDGELIVNVEAMKPSIMRAEHISSEAASIFDSEDLDRLRLSAIADEKENVQRDSFDYLAATLSGPKDIGSEGIMSQPLKHSWAPDGRCIITPPLRTSSANSLGSNPANSIPTHRMGSMTLVNEGKDNASVQSAPQDSRSEKIQKHTRWGRSRVRKSPSKNRTVMAEGIRKYFR